MSTQDPLRQRALVVPDKIERVYRFHQNTLEALRELVQAAGLEHPNQIRATHIVRRGGEREVRLLANLLPFVQPGELLAGMRGEVPWPHRGVRAVLAACPGAQLRAGRPDAHGAALPPLDRGACALMLEGCAI